MYSWLDLSKSLGLDQISSSWHRFGFWFQSRAASALCNREMKYPLLAASAAYENKLPFLWALVLIPVM